MSDLEVLGSQSGLFGLVGDPDAARLVYLGLHAQQHRGEGAAGIVARGPLGLVEARANTTVQAGFDDATLRGLAGDAAIGSVGRAAPFLGRSRLGPLAVAHNGAVTNGGLLRADLEAKGAVFGRGGDAELLLHLVATSDQKTMINRLIDGLSRAEGAWTVLVLGGDKLVAARDPWGFRPLVLGRRGEAWIVASEGIAIEAVGGSVVREVEAGEVVVLDGDGPQSLRPFVRRSRRPCALEAVVAARGDATVFGRDVHAMRTRLGERLAERFPARADVVIAVPDAAIPAALGFARHSRLPYAAGLLRAPLRGAPLVEPVQRIRDFGTRARMSVVRGAVAGQRVVLVDDVLVKGAGAARLVRLLRQAGASEVHLRITTPPLTGPCHYGIQTPERDELLAHRLDLQRARAALDVDSVAWLGVEDLHDIVSTEGARSCDACFTGNYPVEPVDRRPDAQLTLFTGDGG